MLSLTVNADEGVWGCRVAAFLYEVGPDNRRTLVASHKVYYELAWDDADVDPLTSAVRMIRQWAEQVESTQPKLRFIRAQT